MWINIEIFAQLKPTGCCNFIITPLWVFFFSRIMISPSFQCVQKTWLLGTFISSYTTVDGHFILALQQKTHKWIQKSPSIRELTSPPEVSFLSTGKWDSKQVLSKVLARINQEYIHIEPGPELVLNKQLLLLAQSSQRRLMAHKSKLGLGVEGGLRVGWGWTEAAEPSKRELSYMGPLGIECEAQSQLHGQQKHSQFLKHESNC